MAVQYRWLASTATPCDSTPVTMTCGLLPSRPASLIVPSVVLVQYRWLAPAASASAPSWPVTRTRGLLPSRPASLIVLPVVQYRWPGADPRPLPVPVSAPVAARFFPAAVKVAVTVPPWAGVNRTVTVQVLPGARVLQVSPVMANAAAPATLTRSLPVACRPELARVNVCEAVCRTVTCPKSNGAGLNAS